MASAPPQQQPWTQQAQQLVQQYKQLQGIIDGAAAKPGTVDAQHLQAFKMQQAAIAQELHKLTGQNVPMPEMGPTPGQGDPSALIQAILGAQGGQGGMPPGGGYGQ